MGGADVSAEALGPSDGASLGGSDGASLGESEGSSEAGWEGSSEACSEGSSEAGSEGPSEASLVGLEAAADDVAPPEGARDGAVVWLPPPQAAMMTIAPSAMTVRRL